MANKYRVANGNLTDSNTWALTSGGTDYTTTPTSADNAYYDANTPTGTHTVSAHFSCANLDCTGFTGSLVNGTNINTSIYGTVFTLVSGMTYTFSSGTTSFLSAGTTVITSAGKTLVSVVLNNTSGIFQLADDITITGTLTRTAGTFDANTKTVTFSSGNIQSIASAFTGTSAFYNLTKTISGKTGGIRLNANIDIANNFTISGGTSYNRCLIDSSSKGTSRTITVNGTNSLTNADFQDIIGAGTASWDLSATSSGNCGGTTGITFTTPTTTDCSAGSNWSTASWSVRVPLPQDTATFSGASRFLAQDMPRIGEVTFAGSSGISLDTTTTCSFFGSINLTNLTALNASAAGYTYEGRGNSVLTNAGKTWSKAFTLNAPGGKLTFGDAFTTSAAFTHITGELDTAGYSISTGTLSMSGSTTKVLTLGSTVWIVTQASGTAITFTISGTTYTANTATFKCTGGGSGSVTVATSGANTNGATLWNAITGTYDFILTGSGTFGTYKSDSGKSLKFTAGTTTTATTWDISTGCTIGSVTAASHTLAKAGGGTVSVPAVTVSYSTASPTSTFYATGASTNGGNNTNWTFGEVPGSVTFTPRIIWF